MKSIVIYFSQTGNTEKIAKSIYTGIKNTTGQCDLVKIKDVNPHRLQEYDLIGIGTPIFGYTEAPNVRDFINNMRFTGGKHVFGFSTHGTHGEYFAQSMAGLVNSKGMVVLGMKDWYGDCFIPGAPNPYPTNGHPDEIDLREAETFGKEMVKLSQKIMNGEAEVPPLPKGPEVSLKNMLDAWAKIEEERGSVFKKQQTPMQHNKDKCLYPKCQLCMDNCPVDGIDFTVDPPIFADPCMHCMFCAKICPTGAYGDDFLYDTPGEKCWKVIPEFHLNVLVEAEKTGKFRRLVPADQININKPYYKTYNKHPWWIIGKGLNG